MNSHVESYINKKEWRIKENSNQQFSLQGLNTYLSSTAIARYWLEEIYPPFVSDRHIDGIIHIHDLGTLGAYCVGWDLMDLLVTGFTGVENKITSKPARHFRTALLHIVNFLFTLQGETAGANAISNFDTLLAPFIYFDDLSYDEVKQALQEFVYNMNVPTRTGFQSPFTNITMDLVVPKYLSTHPVIIGGEQQDHMYGEFQDEMDVLNRAFAEVMIDGDGNDRPFTFPIPTYNITEDFDWDNEKLIPIWEMTSKYGTPYFSNFIGSDMKPEDARSMCCRLRLDSRELRRRGGGLFGANPLTGSIGVVTINMPRLAYEAKGDVAAFYDMLSDTMEVAKASLTIKRREVERYTEEGLYPYSKFYLRSVKAATGEYWSNHFSTIGLIGMNEAVLNLFGTNMADESAENFAIEVLSFMNKKLSDFQEDTGDLFNLEATPAEGAAYRLAKIDQKLCPGIRIYNIEKYKGDVPYYTNSTQLPVGATDNSIIALIKQEKLQGMYTGGTVFHAFLGDPISTWDATKLTVKAIAKGYSIPYFTITPTFSICPEHGYIAGNSPVCAKCGKVTEIYSRIVGYLRPTSSWNPGKLQEFHDRVEYKHG